MLGRPRFATHPQGTALAHLHAPGLVLQLDPKTLATHGAFAVVPEDTSLSAHQYFVCIATDAKEGLWVPLFAGPGPGRKGIAATAKSGYAQWTRHSSFYDPRCIIRVGHKGAQRAADAAYDRSSPKSPNRMAVEQLPPRTEFPLDEAFRALAP
jgi:hypothetical protein